MPSVRWLQPVSANFDTQADWSNGKVPSSRNDVAILGSSSAGYTVTATTDESTGAFEVDTGAILYLTALSGTSTRFSAGGEIAGEVKVGSASAGSSVRWNADLSNGYTGFLVVTKNGYVKDVVLDTTGFIDIGVAETIGGILDFGANTPRGHVRIDGGIITVGPEHDANVRFFGDGGGAYVVADEYSGNSRIASITGFSTTGATSVQVENDFGYTLKILDSSAAYTDVGLLDGDNLEGFIRFTGNFTDATFDAVNGRSNLFIRAHQNSEASASVLIQAAASFQHTTSALATGSPIHATVTPFLAANLLRLAQS